MRMLVILAAMMITASAQAVTTVQCETGKDAVYKKTVNLVIGRSQSGGPLLTTFTVNNQSVLKQAREESPFFTASYDDGQLQIKAKISETPQYSPYDSSAVTVAVGGCASGKGVGGGTYFKAEYRSGAETYGLTCTCSAQ